MKEMFKLVCLTIHSWCLRLKHPNSYCWINKENDDRDGPTGNELAVKYYKNKL